MGMGILIEVSSLDHGDIQHLEAEYIQIKTRSKIQSLKSESN